MTTLLHSSVLRLLQANCSCNYQPSSLRGERLIAACVGGGGGLTEIQVVYRAEVLSVEGYSKEEMLDAMELWEDSSLPLDLEGSGGGGGTLLPSRADACPVQIAHTSQPLCGVQPAVGSGGARGGSCPVSVGGLVAYMLGELALLLGLLVAGLAAAACVSKARKKR